MVVSHTPHFGQRHGQQPTAVVAEPRLFQRPRQGDRRPSELLLLNIPDTQPRRTGRQKTAALRTERRELHPLAVIQYDISVGLFTVPPGEARCRGIPEAQLTAAVRAVTAERSPGAGGESIRSPARAADEIGATAREVVPANVLRYRDDAPNAGRAVRAGSEQPLAVRGELQPANLPTLP